MYVWADGVHFNVRLDETRLCLLVLVGVRVDGTKELVAHRRTGYRESTESWADLLRDCPARHARPGAGRRRRGAGILGRAARGVPRDPQQRCWVHKTANVLAALPKSAHPGAKRAGRDLQRRAPAGTPSAAIKRSDASTAPSPKAVAKITDEVEELLAFYDYPAEHWVHLRTTNPIESTFATVRQRTKVTKGPGSRAAGLAMAFKLIESAQDAGARSTPPTSSPSSVPAPVRQRHAR